MKSDSQRRDRLLWFWINKATDLSISEEVVSREKPYSCWICSNVVITYLSNKSPRVKISSSSHSLNPLSEQARAESMLQCIGIREDLFRLWFYNLYFPIRLDYDLLNCRRSVDTKWLKRASLQVIHAQNATGWRSHYTGRQ